MKYHYHYKYSQNILIAIIFTEHLPSARYLFNASLKFTHFLFTTGQCCECFSITILQMEN